METGWIRVKTLIMMALAFASVGLHAQPSAPDQPAGKPPGLLASDDPGVVASATFMNGHPDLKHRAHAAWLRDQGRHSEAFTYFQRASRYADKPSQAMVAEMLWKGEGVASDRALAYVWMDMAAERGRSQFLAWREHYWSQLSPHEQERALRFGPELYAEYGDDVAKRRQTTAMRRALNQVTGSRTGWVGHLTVQQMHAGGQIGKAVDGSVFFQSKYWDPELYWDWQDEIWEQLPKGVIDVLPIQPDLPLDDDE